MQAEKAPIQEQEICVGCGFCCDGTLFVHALLDPGERGDLPEMIEQSAYSQGDKDYFRLPCRYFSGKCSIYYSRRAHICGAYRCQLLKDFIKKSVSLEKALEVIERARETRRELLEEYGRLTGRSESIHFMQVLRELGKHNPQDQGEEVPGMGYEVFLARCNIFETLLIKHFRSADDFEKMIMR